MSQRPSHRTLRHTLGAATAAVAIFSLAACGSSGSASVTADSSSQPSAAASAGAQGGSYQGRMPGTTGKIAAKQGTTLQVQNDTDGQVAVTYSAKTAITAQVAAALKDVKVGSCVSVTPASTGSTSSSDSSTVTAGTVRITKAVDGACTGGFGGAAGGSGGAPSGMPTDRPTGMPTDFAGGGQGGPGGGQDGMPSGAPSGAAGGRGMFGANGTVTAVDGDSFTVKSSFAGAPGGSSDSSDASTASTITVAVDDSTTYTTTQASDASALKVGQCVVAAGDTDSTGTVAATTLVVSAPVDGTCTSGFGFGRGQRDDQSSGQGGAA